MEGGLAGHKEDKLDCGNVKNTCWLCCNSSCVERISQAHSMCLGGKRNPGNQSVSLINTPNKRKLHDFLFSNLMLDFLYSLTLMFSINASCLEHVSPF